MQDIVIIYMFFSDVKKDVQELYGLISYSVLRKKLRGGKTTQPSDSLFL